MKYDIVILDFDGTVADTSAGIYSSIIAVLKDNGYPIPNNKDAEKFIGAPIQKSFERYLEISVEESERLADIFKIHYKKHNLLKAKLYDGIGNFLVELRNKGLLMAIATNKRQEFVNALLMELKINNFFDVVCGSDLQGKRSKEDLIGEVTSYYPGLKAVMIGDTELDYLGAKANGIDFVGVKYGFGFKDDLTKYHDIHFVGTPLELLRFFVKERGAV